MSLKISKKFATSQKVYSTLKKRLLMTNATETHVNYLKKFVCGNDWLLFSSEKYNLVIYGLWTLNGIIEIIIITIFCHSRYILRERWTYSKCTGKISAGDKTRMLFSYLSSFFSLSFLFLPLSLSFHFSQTLSFSLNLLLSHYLTLSLYPLCFYISHIYMYLFLEFIF